MITIKVKRRPKSYFVDEKESKDNYIISYTVNGKRKTGGIANSKEAAKFIIKSMLKNEINYDIDDDELNFIINNVDKLGVWDIHLEVKD